MNLNTTVMRWMFNFFPAFRRTGARITHITPDEQRIELKLPLKRATKNYVGTMYGGAMYSALDGILMVMFIRLLGKGYVVWDKSGRVEYLKPGRSTLHATVTIPDSELDYVRTVLVDQPKLEKEYCLEWRSDDGEVCCRVYKLLYFRKRGEPAS